MLILKDDSIELVAVSPALALFLSGVVEPAFARYELDAVVTSGSEQSAGHSAKSLHYAGCAVDIKTRDQITGGPLPFVDHAIALIEKASNIDFDIVVHQTHLHIEFQPKRRKS